MEKHRFSTGDGLELSLALRKSKKARAVQVLLVHGAGVRSNIFSPPRTGALNVDEYLCEAGFDVWKLDWRASIDVPPNEWTLDLAAVYDYPAAIRKIIEVTGASEIRALIHCQGSTSFMLSLVAGLLPEVSTVVSNAVSLHPVVPFLARMKALYAVPNLGRFLPYLNPQWGISAPAGWPSFFDFYVRSIHHECNNPVCKWSSFTYGSGFPTLWSHENLDEATHDWLSAEFAHVPMTFFRQMSRSIRAGHLVTTGGFEALPADVVSQPPRSDARIVLLAGVNNACFLSESQARSFDYLDGVAPGRHSYFELPDYGHLDVFVGKSAPKDVFPLIAEELHKGS